MRTQALALAFLVLGLANCSPPPEGEDPGAMTGDPSGDPTGTPGTPGTPSPNDPGSPAPVPGTPTPGTPAPGTPGAIPEPKNVSFSAQVVPIFSRRLCEQCHSGGGIGKDLGNLTLDGSVQLMFKEVTLEKSPNFNTPRIDLKSPEKSAILVYPLGDGTTDPHPTATFPNTSDADYKILLTWIREGAKQN